MEEFELIVDDSLLTLKENPKRRTTEMFEYRFAVKWHAIQVYAGDELAGFMHVVRHPERPYEWYICDVHTMEPFRKRGVATRMYEKAFEIVYEYEKAYRITSSVKDDNIPSIKLHEKMGFHNSGEASVFPDLFFEEGETIYEYYFATAVPARDTPKHREVLEKFGCPVDFSKEVLIIWAGTNAVGCMHEGKITLLPEWEVHQKNGCLHITEWREEQNA